VQTDHLNRNRRSHCAIDHFGTDQEVWDQRTDSNQYIVSGIYVLAVTEAVDVAGKTLPDQF
jgi:hypothetical protein